MRREGVLKAAVLRCSGGTEGGQVCTAQDGWHGQCARQEVCTTVFAIIQDMVVVMLRNTLFAILRGTVVVTLWGPQLYHSPGYRKCRT